MLMRCTFFFLLEIRLGSTTTSLIYFVHAMFMFGGHEEEKQQMMVSVFVCVCVNVCNGVCVLEPEWCV